MKKTTRFFWPEWPDVSFCRLPLAAKILVFILVSGLTFPALSFAPDDPYVVQQISVSGTVTDAATGSAMPGVNVLVKGTTLGAITGVDGKYTIANVDRNATLVFSFIGLYLIFRVIISFFADASGFIFVSWYLRSPEVFVS